MENAFFTDEDLSVIFSYPEWKIVSTVSSDIKPIRPDRKYLEWINNNCSVHHHREAMFVLSGTSLFTLNGVTYRSSPGTLFLVDADETHDSFYPPFVKNIKHIWFRVASKTIITRAPYCKDLVKPHKKDDLNYISNSFNHAGMAFLNAWDDLVGQKQMDQEFLRMLVRHAFAGIMLEQCKTGYSRTLGINNTRETELHHNQVINAIVENIRKTGGKNLNIDKLAYITGYSRFHFARIFKEVTGNSVLAFINICRKEKYMELSKAGKNKKQVSEELGFSSPAAFSRWLKNANRVT